MSPHMGWWLRPSFWTFAWTAASVVLGILFLAYFGRAATALVRIASALERHRSDQP